MGSQSIYKGKFIGWDTKAYRKEKTIWYCNEFITLDTETSHCIIDDKEYTWITSIQVLWNGEYFLFRKPSELINFYLRLIDDLKLDTYHRVVTIIHNASYDLSFLIPYFQKYLPFQNDRNGIYDGIHKIKTYRQGPLEFRDTYILSGVSLEKWCKDLNTEHQKKVGLYDYNKILYQDSELNEDEKEYDKFDVLALYDCYKKQMSLENDTVASVPITSTGYLRRYCRKATRSDKQYRNRYFNPTCLWLEAYKMCISSYAGGYTHNNRFLKGMTIYRGQTWYTYFGVKDFVIGHRDFRSHYPSQMRVSLLPFGRVSLLYDKMLSPTTKFKIEDVLALWPKYSSISTIIIKSVKLRDKKISMPFMQRSKMIVYYEDEEGKEIPTKIVQDNGRIITFNGLAKMDIDNHTLEILHEQYDMNIQIVKILTFENCYMPACLVAVIDYFFKRKDDLKREVKRCEKEYGEFDQRTIDAKINLQRAKALLNGLYGMFATNPVHDDIDIDFSKIKLEEIFSIKKCTSDEEIEEKLNSYYNSRNSFLPYQVGVFITALARKELYEFIKTIGYDKVLYCDTDSIFYIKDEETEEKIKKLNEEKQKHAEEIHAYIVNDKNEKVYYDYFDDEEDLEVFRGLHSKCYGMITSGGEFLATIAGVPSRTLVGMKDEKPQYITREEELGSIENIDDDFHFEICTGTTCKYDIHQPEIININGHETETAGGAIIEILKDKKIVDIDSTDWTADAVYDDTLIL